MSKKLVCFVCLVLAMAGTSYGLTVTNTGQTTAWQGTPTISCIAPASTSVVQGPANGVISETFTVLSGMNTKLDKIETYFHGLSGFTSTLRLVDLGDLSGAYRPTTYNAGTDLWGGTVTWSTGGTGSASIWEFDFTGAEEVTLTVDHTYAFEFTGTSGPNWRRGGDVYTYGSMYDGSTTAGVRDYVASGAPRAAGMAVYLTPEPATMALLGLGGLALLRRRK